MVSLLTNNASMVALSTLRGINQNLESVQSQISTGKSVANARDNAAVYAISSVMNSDVKGFEAIGSSLALGSSTVAVARGASEQINELLQDIKGSIVSAQEDNVDRSKIQTDISRLRDQITSIVDSAQFNGLNLLQGSESIDILSSLDRAADQSVNASHITVDRSDLTADFGTYGNGGNIAAAVIGADNPSGAALSTANQTSTITFADGNGDGDVTANSNLSFDVNFGDESFRVTVPQIDAGTTLADAASAVETAVDAQLSARGISGLSVTAGAGTVTFTNSSAFDDLQITNATEAGLNNGDTVTIQNGAGGAVDVSGDTNEAVAGSAESTGTQNQFELVAGSYNEGDGVRITAGGVNIDYVASAGDNANDVAAGLASALTAAKAENPSNDDLQALTFNVVAGADPTTDNAFIQIDDGVTGQTILTGAQSGGDAAGGLALLAGIDVSDKAGAAQALTDIESLIQTSVDAAAQFGSAQKRVDIQNDFIKGLTDSLKAGIGSLVDADLEQASAELQSLQVQQQLGIQALTIANQSPQTLLSLFR